MVEIISYAIAAHHGIFDCVDIDHTDIFTEKVSEVEDYDEACINAKAGLSGRIQSRSGFCRRVRRI